MHLYQKMPGMFFKITYIIKWELIYIEIEYVEFYFIYKDFLKMRVSYAVLYSNSSIQHVGVCLKIDEQFCFIFRMISIYSGTLFWFEVLIYECHSDCCRHCQFAGLVISLFITYYVFSTGAWGQDPSTPNLDFYPQSRWLRFLIDIRSVIKAMYKICRIKKFLKINDLIV